MHLLGEISQIDGPLHQQNLQILQALALSTTTGEVRTRCPLIFELTDQIYIGTPGRTIPRFMWAYDATSNTLLVVLQGMVDFDKVAVCLQGWDNPQDQETDTLFPYETGAKALAAFLFKRPGNSPFAYIRVIGHSYGGAVAPYVPKHMVGMGSETVLEVYTYGAPKPGVNTTNLGRRFERATRRVFLTLDPVPLLPLSNEDLGSLWVITGVPLARRWSTWMHPMSGYTVSAGGQLIPLNIPTFQQWSGPIFSLASWATGIRAFGADQHTLAAYIIGLSGVANVRERNDAPATQPIGRTHSLPTTLQLQRERQQAIVQAGEVVAQDPQGTVIGIASGVPIVAGLRFRGAMRQGKNVVTYNGNIVTWCNTRRLRRALVRQLNRTVARP